jgi:hypothetical protein
MRGLRVAPAFAIIPAIVLVLAAVIPTGVATSASWHCRGRAIVEHPCSHALQPDRPILQEDGCHRASCRCLLSHDGQEYVAWSSSPSWVGPDQHQFGACRIGIRHGAREWSSEVDCGGWFGVAPRPTSIALHDGVLCARFDDGERAMHLATFTPVPPAPPPERAVSRVLHPLGGAIFALACVFVPIPALWTYRTPSRRRSAVRLGLGAQLLCAMALVFGWLVTLWMDV